MGNQQMRGPDLSKPVPEGKVLVVQYGPSQVGYYDYELFYGLEPVSSEGYQYGELLAPSQVLVVTRGSVDNPMKVVVRNNNGQPEILPYDN